MSGLEVVAAVSAVVSAFHAGAELVKQIRKKHKRRKNRQSFEEDQLQEELQNGETQVAQRYDAECRSFGIRFRTGDAIARDRLYHIAGMMQAEIIRSLQIALENDNALLNLKALYETTFLNRHETLRVLDELKQRVQVEMARVQQQQALPSPEPIEERTSTSMEPIRISTGGSGPSGYIPSAVTIPSPTSPESRSNGLLTRLISKKWDPTKRSAPSAAFTQVTVQEPIHTVPEWPSQSAELPVPSSPPSRPSTQAVLYPQQQQQQQQQYQSYQPYRASDYVQDFDNLHLTEANHLRQDSHQDDHRFYSPDSLVATYRNSSSTQNTFDRNPSTSTSNSGRSNRSSFGQATARYNEDSPNSANQRVPPAYARHPSDNSSNPDHQQAPVSPIAISITPDSALQGFHPGYPSAIAPAQATVRPAPTPTQPQPQSQSQSQSQSRSRRASFLFSTSLPASNTSSSTSTTTAATSTMHGRPCRDNNYWGFCKGSWAMREDVKKGLHLQSRPTGLYSNIQQWQCKHCAFQGEIFPATVKPGNSSVSSGDKKAKERVTYDQRLHTSAVGIKYRWIFLAKSHVKKKQSGSEEAGVAGIRGSSGAGGGDAGAYNYGCVFCSSEGKETSIFGNVERLMSHIYGTHSANMAKDVQQRNKCVWGREPIKGEAFDVWIPTTYELDGG